MTSRTERIKAVRLAWEREQKLVSEGGGTRDWTPEQQKSILDLGVAFDDEGKAFQGQHMKSVSEYPEYAGNPDNIQFLTRKEHFEAHDGSWQNPTNWYYDPITKQKTDFGEGLIPCTPCKLSEPIASFKNEISSENYQTEERLYLDNDKVKRNEINEFSQKATSTKSPTLKRKLSDVIKKRVSGIIGSVERFAGKHPRLTNMAKLTGLVIGAAVAEAIQESSRGSRTSNGKGNQIRNSTNNEYSDYSNDYFTHDSDFNKESVTFDNTINHEERSSPSEHNVSAHRQRYHKKDGEIIWKDKSSYHRGGSKE